MAKKKQEKVVEVEQPQAKEKVAVEAPKKIDKKPKWEVKDRMYYLKNNLTPLSYSIRAASIYWFDEEKGYERELKSTSNPKNSFCRRNGW